MTFEELPETLKKRLGEMDIGTLSDVQAKAYKPIESGRDVLIKAAASSGKTMAYLLPLLAKLAPQGKGKHFPVILILVPTRELANQSALTCRQILAKTEGVRTAVLCGGTDMNTQVKAFSKGADIVIATPARLLDHIRRHTFKVKKLETLVIDEADMMLSMGFENDIAAVSAAAGNVQKILLSATFPENTRALCETVMNDPVCVEIQEETVHTQSIRYYAKTVPADHKLGALASLIHKSASPVLVFCNRRAGADFVCAQLARRKIRCESIHSEMDYAKRKKIMDQFKDQKIQALIATDVLARGIDIGFLDTVILYDYPEDPSSLLHRTARGGRQMQDAEAVFLLTPKETYRIKEAEKLLHTAIIRL